VVIAAYADNIIIMDETKNQVRNTANRLIVEGRSIGLGINEDKNKYLLAEATSPRFNFSGRYDI